MFGSSFHDLPQYARRLSDAPSGIRISLERLFAHAPALLENFRVDGILFSLLTNNHALLAGFHRNRMGYRTANMKLVIGRQN